MRLCQALGPHTILNTTHATDIILSDQPHVKCVMTFYALVPFCRGVFLNVRCVL